MRRARPRKPRASPLYQCADRHLAELRSEGRLQRLLEERVIERFLKCGDRARRIGVGAAHPQGL